MSIHANDHQIPIHLASREEFARVREALRSAGFENKKICRTLKVEVMSDLSSASTDEVSWDECSPQLALFIRAFILLKFVDKEEVENALDAATLHAFVALGLLRQEAVGAGRFYAPILLHPVGEFYMVSDRLTNPDGSNPNEPLSDAVFPAIFAGTLRFLDLIADAPEAQDALDMCAGSGVGALVLSKRFVHAVSADVTERATFYARFNCLLNDRENVEAVQGDLYEAVKGRTFDCIVAHPPYVPASRDVLVYRDGGTTGETLVQRIVEGLPHRLRPGGIFLNVSFGIDTTKALFEERARSWLGDARDEFDVIFARKDEMTPDEAIEELIKREPQIGQADIERVRRAFADIGTIRRTYGALVIQRHREAGRAPWTTRLNYSAETTTASFVRAFRWHEISARPDFVEYFETVRPRLGSGLEVKVKYRVSNGALKADEYLLETETPFYINSKVDPQMVALLAKCTGRETVAGLYQETMKASLIPQSLTTAEFSSFLAAMIERGYLTLDELEAG